MMAIKTPYDVAIAQLHKDFSFIVVTVEEMKEINSEFPGLDNAEYYDQLEELERATIKALDYFNDAMSRQVIGPEADD